MALKVTSKKITIDSLLNKNKYEKNLANPTDLIPQEQTSGLTKLKWDKNTLKKIAGGPVEKQKGSFVDSLIGGRNLGTQQADSGRLLSGISAEAKGKATIGSGLQETNFAAGLLGNTPNLNAGRQLPAIETSTTGRGSAGIGSTLPQNNYAASVVTRNNGPQAKVEDLEGNDLVNFLANTGNLTKTQNAGTIGGKSFLEMNRENNAAGNNPRFNAAMNNPAFVNARQKREGYDFPEAEPKKLNAWEIYSGTKEGEKSNIAGSLINRDNAQKLIEETWNSDLEGLADEHDKWNSVLQSATDANAKTAATQDSMWDNFTSQRIRNMKVIPKNLTERPEDYNDHSEEYDRELYDTYYGKGAHDRIMTIGTREDKLRMMDELKELWRDVDNGNMARAYEINNQLIKNSSVYDQNEAYKRYAQEQLDNVRRKEAEQADYMDLMLKYGDNITNPKYVAEYDRGGQNPFGMNDMERGVQTSDVHRIYSFIGGGKEYDEWAKYSETDGQARISNEYSYAMLMNPKEKDIFMDKYNQAMAEGREPEEAKAFLQGLQNSLRSRYEPFEKVMIAEGARKVPISSSIASIMMDQVNTYLDIPRHIANALGDKSTESGSSWWYKPAKTSETIKESVSDLITDKIGSVGGKTYLSLMNSLSNVVRGLTTPGKTKLAKSILGLGGFFLQVDQQQTAKYIDQYGYEKARNMAAVDAAFEVAEEFLPYETMLGSVGKNFGLAFLQNATSEAAQELTGTVVFDRIKGILTGHDEEQARADEIFYKGEYVNSKGQPVYLSSDKSIALQQARVQAAKEKFDEAKESAIGGFMGGGFGAVYGQAAQAIGTEQVKRAAGQQIMNRGVTEGMTAQEKTAKNSENVYAFIQAAKQMKEGTESRVLAEQIEQDIANGKGYDKRKIGSLARSVVGESSEKIGNIAKGIIRQSIKEDVQAAGLDDAEGWTDLITRAVTGEETSMMERARLAANKKASTIGLIYGSDAAMQIVKPEVHRQIMEQTKDERSVQETVLDMLRPEEDRKKEAGRYAGMMEGAETATKAEINAAGGLKTRSGLEVIRDGQILEILEANMRTVKEDGKDVQRLKLKLSDNSEVDAATVKAANEGLAKVLRFSAAGGNRLLGANTLNTVIMRAGKTADPASLARDAVRITLDTVMGTKSRTDLDEATDAELRDAAKQDYQAAEAERIRNYRQLKPGQGKVSFAGAEYGTKEFGKALQQLNRTQRNEADAIGKIAKAAGFTVNLIYDPENVKEQGSYSTADGITVNLAGEAYGGKHRSALATLAHEMTHWLEGNSQADYAKLRSFVMNNMQRSRYDVEGELQGIMANYARNGVELDLNGAMAEMIAKSAEEILTNEKVIRQLKESDPGLHGNIQRIVSDMVGRIQVALGQIKLSSSRYAQGMREYADKMSDLWLATYEEAKGVRGTGKAGTVQASQQESEIEHREQTIDIHDAIRNPEKYNDYFTYDHLTKKEPIKLVQLDQIDINKSRAEIVNDAMINAKENGREKGNFAYVKVYDTGTEVRVGNRGIRHSLVNTRLIQPIAEHLGEVLKESVLINTANPKRNGETGTYILLGAGRNSDGKGITYALFHVNMYTHDLEDIDYLYAINTEGADVDNNKKTAAPSARGRHGLPGIPLTVSNVSIAKALESVKEYYASSMSKDVLSHFNINRNDLSDKNIQYLQHSIQDDMDAAYEDAVRRGDWRAAEDMLLEKAQRTEGITGYKAPHFYNGEHQDIAKEIKKNYGNAVARAVEDMAPMIPQNAVLIPMPPHTGVVTDDTDTMILAKALGEATGMPVVNALESDYHTSRYKAKAAGDRSVNANTMGFRQVAQIPEGAMPVFVDNMVGGGQTAMAAKNAIGRGITLAYAQSGRSKSQGVKALTVTYDKDGELIPLSQRIDPNNSSWKYSIEDDGTEGQDQGENATAEDVYSIIRNAQQHAKVRFSMQEPVEANKDGLIAVHNLSAEQLMQTIKLGGFPMPSIAIIKDDYAHNRYGDISVVFYPSTIDPKASRANKVYGGDAWTPTYPSVEYKINTKELKRITDKVNKLVPNNIQDGRVDMYLDNLEKNINSNRGDAVKAVKDNLALKIAYMVDTGKNLVYPTKEQNIVRSGNLKNNQVLYVLQKLGAEKIKEAYDSGFTAIGENEELIQEIRDALNEEWINSITNEEAKLRISSKLRKLYNEDNFGTAKAYDLISGAVNYLNNGIKQETDVHALKEQLENEIDNEEYEEWLRKELNGIIEKSGIRNNKNYYTDTGNRRSWEALHDPETLENVVRVMKSELDKGSNAFFGQSAMLALGTRNLKSLDDIRKHSGQLQHISEEEMTQAKSNIVREFGLLMDEMADKSERNIFIARDRALEAMVEAVRKSKTPAGIMNELRQWHGLNLTDDMGQRIADLVEEIADLPTEYFEAKPQRGVGLQEIEKVIIPEDASQELINEMDRNGIPYETYDGTDEGRLAALNRQGKAKFSIQDDDDQNIRHWMMSVKRESLQTEAEKVLLDNFKNLDMRIDLKNRDIQNLRERIRLLNDRGEENLDADEKKQLQNLRIRLENAVKVRDQAEQELGKIVSSEGYGRMMKNQQRIYEDFMQGKTQQEVTETVERMQKASADIERMIEENKKIVEELGNTDGMRRVREILESTSANEAAAFLKNKYHSVWTKQQLRAYIDPIMARIATAQDLEDEEVLRMARELAEVLVQSDKTKTYEVLQDLNGLTITIGKGAQKELRSTHRSINDIRDKLAGTGIRVRFGDVSSLDSDFGDLRSEYTTMPEITNDLNAIDQFVEWVNGMRGKENVQYYQDYVDEATADVMSQMAAVAAYGKIYVPSDAKARQQILDLVNYMKGLNARTEAAEKLLGKIQGDIGTLVRQGNKAAGLSNVLSQHIGEALEYYDRTAKIAVATARRDRNNQIVEQLKSEHAQKIAKNNEEWRSLIERDRQARLQTEDNRKYRNRINTAMKRTYDLLKNPQGLKNIPEYMQGLARELLETIVDNDLSETRIMKLTQADRKQLDEAKRLLTEWKKQSGDFNIADVYEAEEAVALTMDQDMQVIRDGIEQLSRDIRGKNRLDTLQQRGEILRNIQEAVGEIYTAIRRENEIQVNKRRVTAEDQAYRVATSMHGKRATEYTGKAGRVIKMLHKGIVSGNMTPEYFFRTLGNAGLSELWENYHAAENRNGLELRKAQEKLAEIADKHGYSKWDMLQKITLPLESGDVEMTLGQIMSLWATWKRENTLGPQMSEHLTKGGFYAEKDLQSGILGKTVMDKKAHRVTKTDMDKVRAMLTEEQLQFIDDVVEYMSTDMSELGNEASMAAYGIKMYKEKYYYPFQMWNGIKSMKSNDAGNSANIDRAFHPSFSKTRLHGANNAIILGDFMQTAADHIAGMINYATMGLANESLQKVLNIQLDEGEGTTKRNIRTMMEEAYGSEAMAYLDELKTQLNGGAVRIDKTFYDRLISLFRKNAVAGSLSVAAQQPLSYIRAAVMVNPKYLAMAMNPGTYKGSYKEMMEHSGVAVIKEMGRFDMNAGQSAREYLLPDAKKTKWQQARDEIAEKATILPELMDRMTWTRIWTAVKLEQEAQHPDMDHKSDEFLDMVGERFNDVMRRTQVYDSVLVKSQNMRNQNPGVKMITSFMAEPTLTVNVLADAVRSAVNKEQGSKALLASAGATFLLSAAVQAAVKGAFGAGRNPDEKKNGVENFLYRFWSSFISEVDPLTLIPGYSTAIDLMKGSDISDNALGAVQKIFDAGKTGIDALLGNNSRGVWRDVEDSVGQILQIFSRLPAKNLMRDARAMYNWVTGAFEQTSPYAWRPTDSNVLKYQGLDLIMTADNLWGVVNQYLGEAGYQTDKNAYYQRIYDAKKAGEQEKAQGLIDYLLKGKGVKEESLKSGITKLAKADTSISAAETANFLINEGANAEDYIKGELKEKRMSAEEARTALQKANPDKDADSIWWTVDRIQYQLETGAEKTPSGEYYRLKDAINTGDREGIKNAVKDLTAHGFTKDRIKGKLSDWKQDYLKATGSEKTKLKNALVNAYENIGISYTDANKIITGWEPKNTSGSGKKSKSKEKTTEEKYLAGTITRAQAENEIRKAKPGISNDDLWFEIDRLDFQKATGKDPGGATYYRMYHAIETGDTRSMAQIYKDMKAHGAGKTFKKTILDKYGKQYMDMPNSQEKIRLKNSLEAALKAAGVKDPSKEINNWVKKHK